MNSDLTPSEIAAMLGRLGKGKTSDKKKAASKKNWEKAVAALREKRQKEKGLEYGPNNLQRLPEPVQRPGECVPEVRAATTENGQ